MRKMFVFAAFLPLLLVLPISPAAAETAAESAAERAAERAAAEVTPLRAYMQKRRLALPAVISLREFNAAAMGYAMTKDDVRGLFAELEIPLKGGAGAEYVSGADLLRGCGGECYLEDGLGYLLRGFLRPADLYR